MEESKDVKKVVKSISDEEINQYEFLLGFNSRSVYTLLKGNPFGYKENISFSGTGMRAGISKAVVNFVVLYGRDDDGNIMDSMMTKIRAIVNRDLEKTFVKGYNGQKAGILETRDDIEHNSSALLFSNYFLDKKTNEIYSYE